MALLESLPGPWRIFDLEKGADFQAVADDPELFLSLHTDKIAIDEAQIHPALFPALRVAIDRDRRKMGRYVITGSSSPELARTVTEDLAAGCEPRADLGDLVARALGVSPPAVKDYFEIAEGSFLWRSLPAFTRNVTRRVIKHPKGYVRDSGLGHHALCIPDVTALLAHPQAGNSWEGMVVEEICRQLEQRGLAHDAYHYRTGSGAEVDLVLEGAFGLVAFEIKLGQRIRLQTLRGLRNFVQDHHCRFGVVISNEDRPRLIDEAIVGIPARYL